MPVGNRPTDLIGSVLLDEVAALDRDLGLVREAAAELALSADQDRARLGVDEQLRQVAP